MHLMHFCCCCCSVSLVFVCFSPGSALCPVVFRVVTLWNFKCNCCWPLGVAELWGAIVLTSYQKWWEVNFRFTWVLDCSRQRFPVPRRWRFSSGEAKTHLSKRLQTFIATHVSFFICMHAIQTSTVVLRFNEISWSTFVTQQYYSTFIGKWAKPVIHAV